MFTCVWTVADDAHDAKMTSGFRTRSTAERAPGYEPPMMIQGVFEGFSASDEVTLLEAVLFVGRVKLLAK